MKQMYQLIKNDLREESYTWKGFMKYCVFNGIIIVALCYLAYIL